MDPAPPATIPPTEELPNYNNDNYNFSCSGTTCTLTLSDGQTFVGKVDGDIVSFNGIPYAKFGFQNKPTSKFSPKLCSYPKNVSKIILKSEFHRVHGFNFDNELK